jgi:hypothetical protein
MNIYIYIYIYISNCAHHNPHRLHQDGEGPSEAEEGGTMSNRGGAAGRAQGGGGAAQDALHAHLGKGSGAGAEVRERRDSSERVSGDGSFGTGKKAHWTPAIEPTLVEDCAVSTFEKFQWKHVEMLQSCDFDAQITFNPNKVSTPPFFWRCVFVCVCVCVVVLTFALRVARALCLPLPRPRYSMLARKCGCERHGVVCVGVMFVRLLGDVSRASEQLSRAFSAVLNACCVCARGVGTGGARGGGR